MVVTECLYDPLFDMKPVDQFGFVDLKDALVHGSIPSQIAESEESYNGITDPSAILGKPSDVFDVYRMQNDLGNYQKSAEGDYQKD